MEEFRKAVFKNDFEEARGHFPNQWPEKGTVAHVTAMLGYEDCIKHIMENHTVDLNQRDAAEWTPLMYALANGHHGIAKLLLSTGKCDVNISDTFKQTCLHIEAQSQKHQADVAQELIKQGASLDKEDEEGMTPFLRAVENQNLAVARVLQQAGCKVHACNHHGRYALHMACFLYYYDIVKWLLSLRCSVNVLDTSFQTPLMLCVQQRQPPAKVFHMMKTLLEVGAEVNYQDRQGDTVMLLALNNPVVKKPHIELLLQYGADPNIHNRDGLTPIWQAIYDGIHYPDRIKIVELLLYENAYLNLSCRGKLLFTSGLDSVYSYETFMSPLEVALDSGFYQAARLLILGGCAIQPDLRRDIQAPNCPADLMWLQETLAYPSPLEHQCRLVLRRILGQSLRHKVQFLPLPEKLKDYILFHDIVNLDD